MEQLVDERDISAQRRWLDEQRAAAAVSMFQKRNINAQYVRSRREALAAIMAMIPEGSSVARADSITLDQVEIMQALRARKRNKIFWAQEKDSHGDSLIPDLEERMNMQRQSFVADVFLTGTNAITLDGKIVATDGLGNRVAPIIFGPKKVIVAAGINKLVRDVDEARARIRETCAPMNARRHFEKHKRPWYGDIPCVETGACLEDGCLHERRICCSTIIVEFVQIPYKGRMNVLIIGEDLGI